MNWEEHKKELFKNSDLAKAVLDDEIEEFNKTGEIQYLSKVIEDLLKYSNISITEIQKTTNISRPSVYNIIKNETNPKFDTIQKILNILGYQLKVEPIKIKTAF